MGPLVAHFWPSWKLSSALAFIRCCPVYIVHTSKCIGVTQSQLTISVKSLEHVIADHYIFWAFKPSSHSSMKQRASQIYWQNNSSKTLGINICQPSNPIPLKTDTIFSKPSELSNSKLKAPRLKKTNNLAFSDLYSPILWDFRYVWYRVTGWPVHPEPWTALRRWNPHVAPGGS